MGGLLAAQRGGTLNREIHLVDVGCHGKDGFISHIGASPTPGKL